MSDRSISRLAPRLARHAGRGARLLTFLASVLFSLWCSIGATAEPLRVGVFDVDASPPIGSPLAYDPTVEVTTPLSCRGIVIVGRDAPIVLCAVDWIGIGNDGHRVFREQLATAAGTTMDRVSVHALHQHDAPWCDFSVDSLLNSIGVRGVRFDSPFARQVIERAAEAVRRAVTDAKPVTHVGFGEGKVEQVASNRRILGPDGKVKHVRYTATKDPVVRAYPEGVVDPMAKLISFWQDDQPLVALTYYASHPQSYYRTGLANPDFPGLARNARQAETRVPHIHFCGAGGNIGAGKYNDGTPTNRQYLADRVALGMKRAWDSQKKIPLTGDDVTWRTASVALPPARHLDEKQLQAVLINGQTTPQARSDAAMALVWLRRCQAGERIDIGCLGLGSARILHLPGELFVEYQLAAQAMRPDLFVAMAAYGDYAPCYIGTEIAYSQGGYETQPTASLVAPQVEGVLMKSLRELLDAEGRGPERLGLLPEDELVLQPLFVPEADVYGRFRIPALVATPQGALLAFAEARKIVGPMTGDIDIVLRRSLDQGKTWKPLEKIIDAGTDSAGNPCAVYVPATRTIWLAFTRNRGPDRESEIVAGQVPPSSVWVTSSNDNGETWSPPVDISATARQPDWGWYGTGPGAGIVIQRGRMIIPAYHSVGGVYRSHMLYSDDHGRSWKVGRDVADHTSECQVVERPDGSLVVNCRTTSDELDGRTTAVSRDRGVTWSEVTHDPLLPERGSQGSFLRPTRHFRTVAGETWLYSHPRTSRRSDVSVWLTDDGGRSWPAVRTVFHGLSAYSALAQLPDGSIGVLVECGSRGAFEQIAFGRFTLDWLRAGRPAEDPPTSQEP